MANNGQSDGIQASPNLPFKRKDRKNLRSRPRVGGRFVTQIESAEFDRPLVEPLGCEGSCRCRVEGFATSRPRSRSSFVPARGSMVDRAARVRPSVERLAGSNSGSHRSGQDPDSRVRPRGSVCKSGSRTALVLVVGLATILARARASAVVVCARCASSLPFSQIFQRGRTGCA